MFKKIFICLLVSIGCYSAAISQTKQFNYPKIGQPFPDLQFNDVQHYSSKQLKISDLKGKWVLLDFWNRYCSACIAGFPKLDSLQSEFGGKLKVVLVGYTGSQYNAGLNSDNVHIQKLYDKVKKRDGLSLSIAYDSTAFHQFGVHTPVKIVIDPNGIVRAVTERITKGDIQSFLDGSEPKLVKAWLKNENKVKYDPNLPFLLDHNGGQDTDYLYRSVLSEFKSYMRHDNVSFATKGNRLQVIGVDLATLYRFAFTGVPYIGFGDTLYGKVASNPILDLKDISLFNVDLYFRSGLYAYSISFPSSKNKKANLMKIVQRDLQNYFGYEVKMENRTMPIWRLITASKVKPTFELPKGIPSYPFETVNRLLTSIAGHHDKQGTFIDATGIIGKIDISLICNFDSFDDVKRALRENGFDLVKGEKEMQVVVIKDNPDESN